MMTLRRHLPTCSAVLALALAVLASGCAKKLSVDELNHLPVSNPEGIRGTLDHTPSDLVLWLDHPSEVMDLITPVGGTTDTAFPWRMPSRGGAGRGHGLRVVGRLHDVPRPGNA
jgi:hypothetical protein